MRDKAFRVLGIDPGSHRTGWGVLESSGNRVVHVASGIIAAPKQELASRLLAIAVALEKVLRDYEPAAMSVETIFHAKNSQSALALGHARGVALLCAARFGVGVYEYTAGQIKQAATGRGRAEKSQVQEMICLLLGLQDKMALDTSDALAAALCHAHTHTTPTAALLRATRAGQKGRAAKVPLAWQQQAEALLTGVAPKKRKAI